MPKEAVGSVWKDVDEILKRAVDTVKDKSEVIDILLEKHKDNVKTLNKVISVYKILKSLIKEIQFVEDIVIILTKTYTVEKKTGYTISENEYLSVLETLDSFFQKSKIFTFNN